MTPSTHIVHSLSAKRLIKLAGELGATNMPSRRHTCHGEDHWKGVALMGGYLASETPVDVTVDMEFIRTFAALHDICRLDEWGDPEHGRRAAVMYVRICELFNVAPDADMVYALGHHVGTLNARDYPNYMVGLCWDADRLNLWRVNQAPKYKYLTTKAARTRYALTEGMYLCSEHAPRRPDWSVF